MHFAIFDAFYIHVHRGHKRRPRIPRSLIIKQVKSAFPNLVAAVAGAVVLNQPLNAASEVDSSKTVSKLPSEMTMPW